jgi:polysaccharide biosynthesis protein PslH
MLTPYLPYPTNSGGQIRSNNLIKQLSKKHEITLCSLIKYEEDRKYIKNLEPFCKKVYAFKRPEKPFALSNILKTGFSTFPLLVIRNFSPSEQKALPQIIQEGNFDIIHAETFYVYPHIPNTKIPVVLVDQTIEYKVYEHYVKNYRIPSLKPLLYLDVLKIKFWEGFYWKKAARVVAVSEKDAQIMQQTVKGLKVDIVPNGVGDDFTEDVPLHFNKTILFMGNYAWLQNAEAARILAKDVFPKILKKHKDARLVIAGQFTEKVRELNDENIEILDFEIDDIESVQKYFRESGVLVAPLYGPGGSRLKILSAMAARLPVVTTSIGISGINAQDKKEVLIGESSQEIADLTSKLLSEKDLYKKIAGNARKFVEINYFYEAIASKLDRVYEEVRNG